MEQESLSPTYPFLKRDFFRSNAQMDICHHVTERNFAEKFIFLLNYSNGYLTSCEKKKKFLAEKFIFLLKCSMIEK